MPRASATCCNRFSPNISRIHALGWKGRISIEEGGASTYQWYCAHAAASVAG
jgi:nucleoside-diphosphate-sugar epimerase